MTKITVIHEYSIRNILFLNLLILTIGCQNHSNIKVVMETELGTIIMDLYQKRAPSPVNNFLRYLDEKRFQDAHFYRAVHLNNQPANDILIEVIQGGLGIDPHSMELLPIEHETTKKTGIKHEDGTISMARLEPGTASSEFFICINDQPQLDFGGMRNPDGQGFAAFGKVTSGLNVVKKIQMMPVNGQILQKTVKIMSIKRD